MDAGLIDLENGALAIEAHRLAVLARFRQGGAWDQQRLWGGVDPRYIDFATIAIGLYAAARGIPLSYVLNIQESYATLWSKFAGGTEMDVNYRHVPRRNVKNMTEGYRLFEEGLVGENDQR